MVSEPKNSKEGFLLLLELLLVIVSFPYINIVSYCRHNTRELITVHSRKRMIEFVARTLPSEKLSNTPFALTVVMLLFMKTLTLMNRSFESKMHTLEKRFYFFFLS